MVAVVRSYFPGTFRVVGVLRREPVNRRESRIIRSIKRSRDPLYLALSRVQLLGRRDLSIAAAQGAAASVVRWLQSELEVARLLVCHILDP